MPVYANLQSEAKLGGKLFNLQKISSKESLGLFKIHPDIPQDYISFLTELGFGGLAQDSYMIYSGLMASDEIYDKESAEELKNILFFGDDFMGYCSGFDTENEWRIVEVDPIDKSYEVTHSSFSEFIQDLLED
ncbi:SMI1/KNR4 family protein [uncultured Shewanella sp.]|uniref:SMI1/KNR4 family protein n=1 Tax=uncultured Shewanella sp. TaxID=173975 RepID=UPI00260C9893|nr:SMI1/KNR4 family protein [uncultured Shewanella sp.]